MITKQIDAAINKNQNMDLGGYSCFADQRNERADLQPNESDSAPPITGPIAGPIYLNFRKLHQSISSFPIYQWTTQEKSVKTTAFFTSGYIADDPGTYRHSEEKKARSR